MDDLKSAILFVSDIHYCEDSNVSPFQKDDRNQFYQNFENTIQKFENGNHVKVKYLVITGDLVNEENPKYYRTVAEKLNQFCKTFNIDHKNVLIIPGNHDIARVNLQNYCIEKEIDEVNASEQFEEKLKYYKDFFEDFKNTGKAWNPGNAILDDICIKEENLSILGLNSLVKESYVKKDHVGYVDIEKLKVELGNYLSTGKNIFVALHHSVGTVKDKELPSVENADTLKDYLGINGIVTYIYGHHHTSECKNEHSGDVDNVTRYLAIGSLGRVQNPQTGCNYTNKFTIAVCSKDELELYHYLLSESSWITDSDQTLRHTLPIVPTPRNLNDNCDGEVLPQADFEDEEPVIPSKDIGKIVYYDKNNFIYEQLKKDGNYKDGHFHWKDGRKTLGWVNIAAFLGNVDVLCRIRNGIRDIYEQHIGKVNAVIGYGMEGNIIGSSLIDYWIDNNVEYYFYPSVHKPNEHIASEKSLWNEYNGYCSILFISDMMPTNRYINEILKSIPNMDEVSNVYIISLFANMNILKESRENFNEDIAIYRFALADIGITVCTKDERECMIYSKNLSKVYKL